MEKNLGEKLIYFSEVYSLEEFEDKPLPFNVFHQSGAIFAAKGSILSREKLKNSFVYAENSENKDSVLSQNKQLNSILANQNLAFSPNQIFNNFLVSEQYEEEHADIIESKLNLLDFEPIAEVKANLRKNIFQVKEIFQKKIADNALHLSTKNNHIISKNISNYLETIMEIPAYSTDYIEMISSIRTADNYVTFSHAISVAFYSMAISKKLQMLREDFYLKNHIGRWIPVKTQKNQKPTHSIPFSPQLLTYIDRQKENIQMKYKPHMAEAIFENLHDLMHEYSTLQPLTQYPSLKVNYDQQTREDLTIAALNCDLGKLCLPNNILNKQEKLNDDDWKIIKQHPVYSVSKLKEISDYSNKVLAYILGHHNLNNQVGYPIFNYALPEESKIITLCDMYDAMTSPRNYGKRYSHEQALQYFKGLQDGGYIDLPLYLTAVHTFDEYNHLFVKQRNKQMFS